MANKKTKRSHVSGFVKKINDNIGQKIMSFKVAKRSFILPQVSTFTMAVRTAELCGWNVLVLFDDNGESHPPVTGVICRPLWAQVKAASDGEGYEAVKSLSLNGRPL